MLVYQRVSLKWLCMIKSPKALPGWNISGGLVRCLLVGLENQNRNAGNPPYRETRFFFLLRVFFVFFLGGRMQIQCDEDINPICWGYQCPNFIPLMVTFSSTNILIMNHICVCLRIGYPKNSIVYIEPYFPLNCPELSAIFRHTHLYIVGEIYPIISQIDSHFGPYYIPLYHYINKYMPLCIYIYEYIYIYIYTTIIYTHCTSTSHSYYPYISIKQTLLYFGRVAGPTSARDVSSSTHCGGGMCWLPCNLDSTRG